MVIIMHLSVGIIRDPIIQATAITTVHLIEIILRNLQRIIMYESLLVHIAIKTDIILTRVIKNEMTKLGTPRETQTYRTKDAVLVRSTK